MKNPIQLWRENFLFLELVLSILLTLGIIGGLEHYDKYPWLVSYLADGRKEIYGAFASILGALLGFIITAVSIILGFNMSDSLKLVRESKHYPKLWQTYLSTIRGLALATIIALSGLIVDVGTIPTKWIVYPMIFSLIFVFLRFARAIWILEKVVLIVSSANVVKS